MKLCLLILLFFIGADASEWQRVNFIHIPKTAGMSMRSLIQEELGAENVYPYTQLKQTWPILHVKATLKRFPTVTHSAVAGHLPVWFLEKKDPTFFTTSFSFTILRDPIERVLSHYFYLRSLGTEISSPLVVTSNFMCHFLSSDPHLEGEALLESAVRNLERLDFIVFMDDYEGGVQRLFRRLGFAPRETVPHLNVTPRERTFDQEMMRKIVEMNSLDIKLYEYATTHLRNKSA